MDPADTDLGLHFTRRAMLLSGAAVLSGCGGGGASSASAPVATVPAPSPTTAPPPTPTPTPAGIVPSLDGVLFDTDRADNFTDLLFTPSAAAQVSASSVSFSSTSDVIVDLLIANSDRKPMEIAFDQFEIEATLTVRSLGGQGENGILMGVINGPVGAFYGAEVRPHPGISGPTAVNELINASARLGFYNGTVENLPRTVRNRYVMDLTAATFVQTSDGLPDQTQTLVFVPNTSRAGPSLFSRPAVRFQLGSFNLTRLKLTAKYPQARYACVGDSLTLGASAEPATRGWAHLLRADHLSDVLIAAGSGSTAVQWSTRLEPVLRMAKRVFLICLGTNDRTGRIPLADTQNAITTIVRAIEAHGGTPVVMSMPASRSPKIPLAEVQTFNAWLAGQGWRRIDIFTVLADSEGGLRAEFDSGDGVHWNNAGHAAVHATVTAYLASNGL